MLEVPHLEVTSHTFKLISICQLGAKRRCQPKPHRSRKEVAFKLIHIGQLGAIPFVAAEEVVLQWKSSNDAGR